MHTGLTIAGRPTLPAWVAYGLGTENQDLPAYVVLPDPSGLPVDGIRNWSSGWLPPVYQGTPFRSEGMPVLNLQPRTPRPADVERGRLELLSRSQRRAQVAPPRASSSSTPASPASSWPPACSSRPPTHSTSRRNRRRRRRSTASTTRSRAPTAPAA